MTTRIIRSETVTETTTLVCVRIRLREIRQGWCSECGGEVVWYAPTEIESFRDLPALGAVHKHGEEVCFRSLIKQLER